MNKSLIIFSLIFVSSCSLQDFSTDINLFTKVQGHSIFETDFGEIHDFQDIGEYISDNIQPAEDPGVDYWENPEQTLERGFGDCDDVSLVFLNIAFVELGIEMDLAIFEAGRYILAGGPVNHVVPYYDGKLIDPYSGEELPGDNVGYWFRFEHAFGE